jgi:pentatricopeptide repeat protein
VECVAFVKGVEALLNCMLEAKDVKGVKSVLKDMLEAKEFEIPAKPAE